MSEKLNLPVRVYWEDTDASGIVYHANYIKFMERARSNFMTQMGYNQNVLREKGFGFVVAKIEIAYKRPAKLDETLSVKTRLLELKNASMVFEQCIWRDNELLTEATVRLGFINIQTGRPEAIPADMREKLLPYLDTHEDN